MHEAHPNYDHHALSAVWSKELQGIADKTSHTEDRESWRILEDLQKTARTLAANLGRHPDKFSTEEYKHMHILAADKKHFLQTPLDKSEYVLLEWLTTSEFADTHTFCSKDMNNCMASIPDQISRAYKCLCCKYDAPVDWCHAKGSAVCALLAHDKEEIAKAEKMGAAPHKKPFYSAFKHSGAFILAGMVFHKSCLDFLRHVTHCVIQGDQGWGQLSPEDAATLAGRTVHEVSLQEAVQFLLAANMSSLQRLRIQDTLMLLTKWTNRANEPCMIFGPFKEERMNDSTYWSKWIQKTPIPLGKVTFLLELASGRCITWPIYTQALAVKS
jgi:hypothetical protein